MTPRNYEWTKFKLFVTQRNCSLQYFDEGNNYLLWGGDGPIQAICVLFKTDPASDEQIDFETNFKSKGNKSISVRTLPFADKILPNGKKIYTRIHGIEANVQGAPYNIDFIIPYASCKITGIEIIGGKLGDKANFKVLDSETGIYTTIPHYLLNQFGFLMNVTPNSYVYKSDYDADLFQNMVLRIEYDASEEPLPRPVYINFILHEIKD